MTDLDLIRYSLTVLLQRAIDDRDYAAVPALLAEWQAVRYVIGQRSIESDERYPVSDNAS